MIILSSRGQDFIERFYHKQMITTFNKLSVTTTILYKRFKSWIHQQ